MAPEGSHRAKYAEQLMGESLRCCLCPHGCVLSPGATGLCGVRRNEGGALIAATYGVCPSMALDPIEKKPLYHFHPGMMILSLGGWGCNLTCKYCQNHELSQQVLGGRRMSPEDVVAAARREPHNLGVAFTYNEPLICFEFVLDCAIALHEAGLKTILVTNGFINEEPLSELLPWVDAANVDLKSMADSFYSELCGGRIEPVLNAIKAMAGRCHLEVTKLLVTGHADPAQDAEAVAEWVAENVSPATPLHLSRYFPQHLWREPATSSQVVRDAVSLASQHLDFVYTGNIATSGGSDTHCRQCGTTLIHRGPMGVSVQGLDSGKCRSCGEPVPVEGICS